ncbi:unnamed protein product [Oikopleura dioica]|uniref:phosphatidate phosphatase n=1 Tax=Oikopleura dioica TaxID=34765 RepID=E4X282_OIKDI|nr:unnamed protein product [Oikopleura dioica]
MGILDYFTNFSPLSSAIDIVVIEQPDGTLRASPFHVQIGFATSTRPLGRNVDVNVNGAFTGVTMKLGRGGDAFFVDPNDVDKILSPPESPKKGLHHHQARRRKTSNSDRVFDPSSALSDSEIECTSRPNIQVRNLSTFYTHTVQGYLSDPEIEFGATSTRPPATPSLVKVWKWGQLPVEESISSTSNAVSTNSFQSASSAEFEARVSTSEPAIATSVPEPASGPSENENDRPSGYDADSMIDSTDDEEESNTGESEPFFGRGVQISLCGGPGVPEDNISPEEFNRFRVSWDTYSKDPRSIIENPRLVIRENDRYMNFLTVASILVARIFFESDLDQETIQKLKTPEKRPWFFFRSKQNRSLAANNNDSLEDSLNEESSTSPVKQKKTFDRFKGKTLTLEHEDLVKFNLQPGRNKIEFVVASKYQGRGYAEASIYLWHHTDKIIVSDIDGTVTKSDVVGQLSNIVYYEYSHHGIHNLYNNIAKNNYKFMYVSSRAISQSHMTKTYINWTEKDGKYLPNGPVLLNPSSLVSALLREVWTRNPEEFKIDCLTGIRNLFPGYQPTPFYAGFGNKMTDETSYLEVEIPKKRIFTISKKGVVKNSDPSLQKIFSTTYDSMAEIVDFFFPQRRSVS